MGHKDTDFSTVLYLFVHVNQVMSTVSPSADAELNLQKEVFDFVLDSQKLPPPQFVVTTATIPKQQHRSANRLHSIYKYIRAVNRLKKIN